MTDLAVQLPEANRRLDAIDRKILTVLQEDASLSVAEIGDRVGLSSTPCWKRIQRLEADGVILRRVALVDQNKIGLGITVFVSVESARPFRGLAEDLRRRRQRHAGGDGILPDGRRRRLHAARRGRRHGEL